MDPNSLLDQLYTAYLEDWVWLGLLGLTTLMFIIMLIDRQRRNTKAVGWLISVFLCIVAFLPVAIYVLGPQEAKETLRSVRVLLFYVGALANLISVMLAGGYALTYRGVKNEAANHSAELNDKPFVVAPDSEDATQFGGPENFSGAAGGSVNYNYPEGFRDPEPIDRKPSPSSSGGQPIDGRPKANAWMVDVSNPEASYQLFEGDTTIGRGANNDIVISDMTVSKAHLLIRQEDGHFRLKDRGSYSGTLLNDVEVEGHKLLYSGDVITIGDRKLKFIFDENMR